MWPVTLKMTFWQEHQALKHQTKENPAVLLSSPSTSHLWCLMTTPLKTRQATSVDSRRHPAEQAESRRHEQLHLTSWREERHEHLIGSEAGRSCFHPGSSRHTRRRRANTTFTCQTTTWWVEQKHLKFYNLSVFDTHTSKCNCKFIPSACYFITGQSNAKKICKLYVHLNKWSIFSLSISVFRAKVVEYKKVPAHNAMSHQFKVILGKNMYCWRKPNFSFGKEMIRI